MTLIRILGTL